MYGFLEFLSNLYTIIGFSVTLFAHNDTILNILIKY